MSLKNLVILVYLFLSNNHEFSPPGVGVMKFTFLVFLTILMLHTKFGKNRPRCSWGEDVARCTTMDDSNRLPEWLRKPINFVSLSKLNISWLNSQCKQVIGANLFGFVLTIFLRILYMSKNQILIVLACVSNRKISNMLFWCIQTLNFQNWSWFA